MFFQPVAYMKPIFSKKWNEKLVFLKQTNMVFKKINTFFEKNVDIFVYCPESLLKVCCKFSVKLSGGVASLTETFNANLQGWIESFNANFQCWIESLKKLAGLHWKFAWKFHCSPASFLKLSVQPWKFALKLSIQPCKFALKVSVKLATPPWKFDWKFATKFQQSFRAVNKKYRQNLFFSKKVFIFLKTMFVCFKKRVFHFKKCFFKIDFMYATGWKIKTT